MFVFSQDVFCTGKFSIGPVGAVGAGEGLLLGVGEEVPLQHPLLGGPVGAVRAGIRALPRVGPHMQLVRTEEKSFVGTKRALVGLP